ncbi:MAG: hypothetical protein NC093_07415 [Alistipes sp.]|nr:hypothetical protein [Alistipes sp.]
MKNKRKKLAVLMASSLTVNLIGIAACKVSGASPGDLGDIQAEMLENSINYLVASHNSDGSFGNYVSIINDTAEAAGVLRNFSDHDISSAAAWLKSSGYDENIDTLARTAAACKDSVILDSVVSYANADGGFGLYKDYASDVLDSVLVLDAINSCGSENYIDCGSAICLYLIGSVNSDGGWSYSPDSASDIRLTSMVTYSLDKFLDDNMLTSVAAENALSASTEFLRNNSADDFDRESIEETLYSDIALMQYDGSIDYRSVLNGLSEVQSGNGSFYNDVHLTALAVKLLGNIDLSDSVKIKKMTSQLNAQSGYFGKDMNVVSQYSVSYSAAAEAEYTLKTTVTNGETVIYTEEAPVVFSPDRSTIQGIAADFVLNEMRDDGIFVTTQLCSGDKIVANGSQQITLAEIPAAGSTELTDFTLELDKYSAYVGMPVEVSAEFDLLFATNVENSVDMKLIVNKDGETVDENTVSVQLIPSENSLKMQGIVFTPDTDSEGTYVVTAQCMYENEVVAERSCEFAVKEQVVLEDITDDPDAAPEIVVNWAGPVLSDYCIYAGTETIVDANAEILYYSNGDFDGIISMQVVKDGEVIAEREESVTIEKGDIEYPDGLPVLPRYTTKDFLSFEVKDKSSVDVIMTFSDPEGNVIAEGTRTVKILEKPVQDLILNSSENNTGIDLSWNDITSDFESYHYRLFRRTETNDWESRSIWNESEKVEVLNIYPASPYLETWMTTTISDTETPAGMGLFDIDSVSWNDFNATPETYLLDENGSWKYDVLFFGSADSNGGKDLNETSYNYVKSYADSGRGILFGHDSIDLYLNHTWCNKFADDFDMILKLQDSSSASSATSSVYIENIGTLTNFPWTLRGTLNIPRCHSSGQYVGGSLTSTEWIRLNGPYSVDEETGARSGCYLTTNKNLGMIQTGHSAGQATDDERKVLANTLFYLHQLSDLTTAKDSSFYDIDAPDMPDVTAGEISGASVPLSIASKDNPTVYEYYIAAEPSTDQGDIVKSNVVTETAFADMKGFVVEVSDSSQPSPELIEYDENNEHITNVILCDAQGTLTASAELPDYGKQYYIHVFAVDNADNVSEEVIIPVGSAKIEASVNTDKDIYTPGETVSVSSASEAVKFGITADGELSIYDEDGNLTLTLASESERYIAPDENVELAGAWTIPEIMAGKYTAEIVWKDGENEIAKASHGFRVAANGSLDNFVHTDKLSYRTSDPVEILSNVVNSSTNSAENGLVLDIEVYNSQQRIAASFSSNIGTLHPKSDYSYNDIIKSGKLAAGKYTVHAAVRDESGQLTEDSAEFDVIESSAVMTGKLSFSPEGEISQRADFSVTNESDVDVSEAVIRVEIYSSGELVGTIIRHSAVGAGETLEFNDIVDTRKYGVGDYYGILTAETAEERTELDTAVFTIDAEYVEPAVTTVTTAETTTKAESAKTTAAAAPKSNSPKTGDDVPLPLWISTIVSALGLIAVCVTGGKKNAEKKN